MPMLRKLDEQVYHRLHQKSLHQPTRREKELNKNMHDAIRSPAVLKPKIWNHKIMYPHYMFDSGKSINFPKEFYKWWKIYYTVPILPIHNTQIRLVGDTNRTLESFFIHKKPSRDILTKMETA
jgi:hypothetical protein